MSKLRFRREIVRGVVLGAILLSGMLLAIAIYHSSRAAANPPQLTQPTISAVEEAAPPPEPEIAKPPSEISPTILSPNIGKHSRPGNAGTPQIPAVSVAIHEEEASAPAPPITPEISVAPA